MAKWLIDPGHGGSDPGATYKGRRESDDVLRLSKRVGEILAANGELVSYTRTVDTFVSLSARSSMENRGVYNYFVSIHRNAVGAEVAKGVETHIYGKGGAAEKLAIKVNANLVGVGFVNRNVKVSNFHVLRETKCPSILIECGFIDHTSDNNLFDSKFEQIAQAIAKGCLAQVGKSLAASNSSSSSNTSSSSFKVGDKVVVSKSATHYATGQSMASFVKGSTYTVQEVKSDRCLLSDIVSWVYNKDLSLVGGTSTSYTVKITADVLNVRTGPGTGYAVATTVKQNEVYTIVEEKNGWGKLKSGAGWISLDYVKKC